MFAIKSLNSNLSHTTLHRSPHIPDGTRRRRIRFSESWWRVSRSLRIQAVIAGGDQGGQSQSTATTSTSLDSRETNASLLSSSSSGGDSSGGEGIEVKAVVTIKKKMKEKLIDRVEDQWEYFINGVGQGIQIQLISDQIDPG